MRDGLALPLPDEPRRFFVPERLIGMLIAPMSGSMIGAGSADDAAPTASARRG